ncbi:hypothetical protein [Rhabdaerophilum sp. SD176]|uniref:hypothetical protein n=1 Tax=Rhabdaerophilum sp. SD176 TaxID=2983548 RepID=UPI0024DFBA39|nr:hypothetical protein [Rhabdaerophilum sp. SD176]
MVDYHSLLNRAIASLGNPDAEARASIYGRARDALQRQLRSFDPPLAEDEIRAQLDALEAVIIRVEAEQATLALPDTPEAPEPGMPAPPVEDESTSLPPADPVIEPILRPRMPNRGEATGLPRKRLSVFVGIGIVAMLAMGLLALTRNGKPVAPAGPPVVTAPAESGSDPAKTEGRLSGAEPQPTPADPAPSQPAAPAQSQAASPPAATPPAATPPATNGAVVTAPATGRAFMVLEPAPGAPNQFEGRVNWSYLPDTTLGGQKSLRAVIEFAGSTLSIDFSIARNADAALSASHTVMVIFDGQNGLGNVLEMSAVEWREREDQVGGVLAGIVVPIQTNVFMIGLDKAEATVTRNLDLLRTQKWMVFEFRLETGRRGAVLVEKSAAGERAIAEALRDWRQ